MRIALTTLLALTSTPALAQTVLTALGGGTILEPSTGSVGTDRDGYPPSSGPADPEEGMIAFRIDVGAAILSPVAVLLDDDADGVDDLRIDEAGATPTEARRNLDNLDGALDGRLAPGSYTIYWNLNKTNYDTNLPASAATQTFRGDIERFTLRVEGSNISAVTAPPYTVSLDGASSVSQNDLRWLETYPSSVRASIGETFVMRTMYSVQSAGGLSQLILQSFYNGRALRLERSVL